MGIRPRYLILYSVLYMLALPLLVFLMAFHPRLRGGLWQRLTGRIKKEHTVETRRPIWLHGSSAGDIIAIRPIAEQLEITKHPIAISAWTYSGIQMATRYLEHKARIFRAPLDLAAPVHAVLSALRPQLLVLECLELWPRLVYTCQLNGIPVVVVNGRLSTRSLAWYQRFNFIFKPCFQSLTLVQTISPMHAERFIEAGVPESRVVVDISSKYSSLQPSTKPPRHKIVLGSLHRQEEEILLPWIKPMFERQGDLEVIIAPRYPHRAKQIQRRLEHLGLTSDLWSEWKQKTSGGQRLGHRSRIQVIDDMGVLAEQYQGARVAFVGGSLIRHGGHNPLEPAACGTPVLVGPYTDNCRQEVELLLGSGAAVQIKDGRQFFDHVIRYLTRENDFTRGRSAGLEVVSHFVGSAKRTAERILGILG